MGEGEQEMAMGSEGPKIKSQPLMPQWPGLQPRTSCCRDAGSRVNG